MMRRASPELVWLNNVGQQERARREERQEVAERCSTGRCRRGDAHGIEENVSETRHAQIRFARGNSAERVHPLGKGTQVQC